ncbi:MAG: hypothetical protein ACK4GB_01845 [Tepidimonas sp.]
MAGWYCARHASAKASQSASMPSGASACFACRAMEVRPRSPQALYLQAVLAARAQRFDLARQLLTRAGGGVGQLPGGLLLGGATALKRAFGRRGRSRRRRHHDARRA